MRERAGDGQPPHLTAWLIERARTRGDLAGALALTEELFWREERLLRYQELRSLALPVGRWDELRRSVLSRVVDEGQYTLLTQIYLDEKEIDLALEALRQADQKPPRRSGPALPNDSLRIRVAEGAEETRPRAANTLYVEIAERLIARRGRGNYAEAAAVLLRARKICERLGDFMSWDDLITDLRERNRRLPALQDELSKAGL